MSTELKLPESIDGIDFDSIHSISQLQTLNADCEQLINRIKGVQVKINERVESIKDVRFELKKLAFLKELSRHESDFFEELVNGETLETSSPGYNYTDSINRKFGFKVVVSKEGSFSIDFNAYFQWINQQNQQQETLVEPEITIIEPENLEPGTEEKPEEESSIKSHNYNEDGYSYELSVDHSGLEAVNGYFLSFFTAQNNFTAQVPIDEFEDEVNFKEIAKALPAGFVILKREGFYKVFNFLDDENEQIQINNIFNLKRKGSALQANLEAILRNPIDSETHSSFEFLSAEFTNSDLISIKKYVIDSPCMNLGKIVRGRWKIDIKSEFLENNIMPTIKSSNEIVASAKSKLDKIWG